MTKLKDDQLTAKDMSVLREEESPREQHKKNSAPLRDYTLCHNVHINWKDNIDRKLRPFVLRVDNKSFVLSYAELKELSDEGFFRRETDYKRRVLRKFDGRKITLSTELNEEAERDMMVLILGEGFEILVDWYQFMRAGRFI